MASFWEPEEFVGGIWHRLVGDTSSYPRHPQAAVRLEEVRIRLGVLFRALGGPGAVRLAGVRPRPPGIAWASFKGSAWALRSWSAPATTASPSNSRTTSTSSPIARTTRHSTSGWPPSSSTPRPAGLSIRSAPG